ncbi:MAG: hypothetical protein JNK84_06745 [Phreatobacter sp.]|uniref:hypothetical protein n=1 Tax=Phreatobacter sp. TaxID=1966341 RepID=UPI001A492203|nr:hypothetical protein [Phreatobacter sp.]MBL8568768.1 hypothetical protein [Phreatobacter sp.]
MALILQVVAAALTVLGAGTLYWGTTPSLLSLGNTVMVVGAVIAAAGIILFGLAAVLGQLGVLAAKLDDLRWAAGHAPAAEPMAAPAGAPAHAALPAEPSPDTSPFWREGLPEQPATAAMAVEPPRVEAPKVEAPKVEAPKVEAPAAEISPAPPSRPVVTPPSRESFGLRPLGTAAAIGAATGLAAGVASASAAAASPVVPAGEKAPLPPPPAEQAAGKGEEMPEPVRVEVAEPVLLEPVAVEPVVDGRRDVEEAEPVAEAAAVPHLDALEEHLAQALEDLKEEVRAAEADIAPPAADTETKAAAPEAHDPMASLEKLLLGDTPARTPAPAPADEREPGGFMARLRDTFSRPPAPPAEDVPEPAVADKAGEAAPEPVPAAHREVEPEPAEPSFSIEDELEKALKASLDEKPIGAPDVGSVRPEPPAYASPGSRQATEPMPPPAPELRVTPEPALRPAPEVTVERAEPAGGREDAMASLVRDFPELNDLLAPKKKAVDPADSLIEDLKGIFEPQAGAAPARQEPVVVPPAPAPAAPAQPAAPLLREGVIANIPFRLYGDGTIEADLEAGTTRFTSLKEFRAHVGG